MAGGDTLEKSEHTSLTAEEKKAIRNLYSNRLKDLGISPQTVGWSSKEQQDLRFQILTEIGITAGSSICDVGCGLGDLYDFLTASNGLNVRYTGIDISPELIEAAKSRFPEVRFDCQDILDISLEEEFDWVFLSGALNFRITENWKLTQSMLKKMYAMARKGVACNFLTTNVDFQAPINFHHDPAEVAKFAASLTNKWVLRHDYPLWEFSLYLKK
jgi:trans-aconitate methyltransferase